MTGLSVVTLTYPLEVLRKRRQVQILKEKTKNMNYINLIKHIYKKQGYKGFYSGLSVAWCKAGPYFATIFTANEFFNGKLANNK